MFNKKHFESLEQRVRRLEGLRDCDNGVHEWWWRRKNPLTSVETFHCRWCDTTEHYGESPTPRLSERVKQAWYVIIGKARAV